MSDETLRTANRRALWAALAITLGPLAVMPFAARNAAQQPTVQVGMQDGAQPVLAVPAQTAARSS